MAWRFAGRAEERIDQVVLDSARSWGIAAAARDNRLIFAAIDGIGEAPTPPGSRPVTKLGGVFSYHLHFACRLVPAEQRVGNPRLLLVYRIACDGIVEILGLVHDRQLLTRAARRAQREAGG